MSNTEGFELIIKNFENLLTSDFFEILVHVYSQIFVNCIYLYEVLYLHNIYDMILFWRNSYEFLPLFHLSLFQHRNSYIKSSCKIYTVQVLLHIMYKHFCTIYSYVFMCCSEQLLLQFKTGYKHDSLWSIQPESWLSSQFDLQFWVDIHLLLT